MVDHEYIRQLISATFDGEATPQEKELVEEHIKTCAACQKFFHDLTKLSSALKTWSDETLSPDLEQKITQRLTSKHSKEGKMDRKELVTVGMKSGVLTLAVVVILFSVQVYMNRGLQARLPILSTLGGQGRLKSSAEDIGEQYSEGNGPGGYKTTMAHSKTNDTFKGGLASSSEKKQDDYLKARGYSASSSSTDKLASLQKKEQYQPYDNSTNYSISRDANVSPKAGTSEMKYKDSTSPLGAPVVSSPPTKTRFDLAARSKEGVRVSVGGLIATDESSNRMRAAGGVQAQVYSSFPQEQPEAEKDFEEGRYQRGETIYPPYPVPAPLPVIPNTEQYDEIYENPFLDVREAPLSTFSIDVDKASYANIRRFLNSNQLPPKDAVRIEEMINYFNYDYPPPLPWEGPFSITTEAARCPWNPRHQLVMIGLQAKKIQSEHLPPSNLVFLIDVSGSMADSNKLPLLKSVFKLLVNKLRSEDRVSIVVYAGEAGLVLESTPGSNKERIMSAIDNLQAGGSTAGGEGILLAYRVARENFISSGNNRVILATDGDFNVGVSSDDELTRLIEQKRDERIFLTVLGVGTGNYKDSKMEKLADKGNGNYAYLDNVVEGEKVLVNEMSATLLTVAKDVKIQVEFNPSQVKAYKLIGYENRILNKEDFNDDRKDAGEIGAGHSVTAFYEIVPTEGPDDTPYGYRQVVDPLKYQADESHWRKPRVRRSNDLMTIKLRYKEPKEDESKLITKVLTRGDVHSNPRSENFKFAAGVAEFGLLLRDSQYQQEASFDHVIKSAQEAIGRDPDGYRSEFLRLVKMAQFLKERR